MHPLPKKKTSSFSEIRRDANEMFSFILVFCPNWPSPLENMTTAKAFEELIGFINALLEQSKSDESKQWLRICLQEIRRSWKQYDENDLSRGKKTIQQAEDYLKNAFSKKEIQPRFIVSEKGAAQDAESGFPS